MATRQRVRQSGAQHGERAETVYRQVRDLVVRGRLAPGVPALEARLARRFGVSRTPVRESLARLAHEGFLVSGTNGRRTELVVAPLRPETVPELWALVGRIEGLAIESVSLLGTESRRQLARSLARINDELASAAAARTRDIDSISELMTDFHVCFMDQCAGEVLRPVYSSLRPHVRRYEWAYGMDARARYDESTREHRGIVDAIAAGDGARARRLIERHWANGAKRTLALIGRSGR
jgi:DNA-binding GntR family transcriptional regulator